MKCTDTHKKLIFYMENELNANEMQVVRDHIEICKDCKARLVSLQTIYQAIDLEKKEEFNPFLLTRIQEGLKKGEYQKYVPNLKVSWIPLLSTGVLIVALFASVWFGTTVANMKTTNTYADVEMRSFLNDFQQEFVESVITNE